MTATPTDTRTSAKRSKPTEGRSLASGSLGTAHRQPINIGTCFPRT